MTQKSLITRLKAVKEALEVAQVYVAKAAYRSPTAFLPSSAKENLDQIDAALSDLRELIKEAEAQEPKMFLIGDGDILEELAVPVAGCVLLYPALGEKLAAAKQQQAKETKE